MTAKEIAIKLIKHYVERGDSIKDLQSGQMGSYCGEYKASIGGAIFPEKYHSLEEIMKCPKDLIKKVPSSQILVEEVGGKVVNEVFSLAEIYQLIKNKKGLQLSLI